MKNQIMVFNPHIHCIAIKYANPLKDGFDSKLVPIGVCRWSGVIETPKSGIRSWWYCLLKRSWGKHMLPHRPYPEYRFGKYLDGTTKNKKELEAEIQKILHIIDKATIYDFSELTKYDSLEEKTQRLKYLITEEKEKFLIKAPLFNRKKLKAPKVTIKSLYYEVSKNGKNKKGSYIMVSSEANN